jgi:hypothetical protein
MPVVVSTVVLGESVFVVLTVVRHWGTKKSVLIGVTVVLGGTVSVDVVVGRSSV